MNRSRNTLSSFVFRRHVALLICATAIVAIMARVNLFGAASVLPSAAVYAALHAISLAGALDAPAPLLRKALFVGAAIVLNVLVLYAGLLVFGLVGAAGMGMTIRAFAALAACSLAGAVGYGLIIRGFWLPRWKPRAIMQTAIGCLICTMLALLIEESSGLVALWVIAPVWWCAFSTGLWITIQS